MLFGYINKVRYMNSLVKCIKYFSVFGIVFLFFVESVFAQSEKVFTISEFVQDPFDLSGRGENTKKVDGSGYLYAIVSRLAAADSQYLAHLVCVLLSQVHMGIGELALDVGEHELGGFLNIGSF